MQKYLLSVPTEKCTLKYPLLMTVLSLIDLYLILYLIDISEIK